MPSEKLGSFKMTGVRTKLGKIFGRQTIFIWGGGGGGGGDVMVSLRFYRKGSNMSSIIQNNSLTILTIAEKHFQAKLWKILFVALFYTQRA